MNSNDSESSDNDSIYNDIIDNDNIDNDNIDNDNIDNDNIDNFDNENILNTSTVFNYIMSKSEKRKKMRIDNYDNIIEFLLNRAIPKKISKIKIDTIKSNEIKILNFNEYNSILLYDYKINNLKSILKYYNQKISGNKHELELRIYNYLLINYNSIIIQKIFRCHMVKRYIKSHGPAAFKRSLCCKRIRFLYYGKY